MSLTKKSKPRFKAKQYFSPTRRDLRFPGRRSFSEAGKILCKFPSTYGCRVRHQNQTEAGGTQSRERRPLVFRGRATTVTSCAYNRLHSRDFLRPSRTCLIRTDTCSLLFSTRFGFRVCGFVGVGRAE